MFKRLAAFHRCRSLISRVVPLASSPNNRVPAFTDATTAMLCFTACLLSLASAYDATSGYRTPSDDRKQRIVHAMSVRQEPALHPRGAGTVPIVSVQPNYRKERMLRAVASGQAVTMKLRGGDSSTPEELLLLRLRLADGTLGSSLTSCRRGEAAPQGRSAAFALVKHTPSSGTLPCVHAAEDLVRRPTRMDHRRRRMLRSISSGQAVMRRLYCC